MNYELLCYQLADYRMSDHGTVQPPYKDTIWIRECIAILRLYGINLMYLWMARILKQHLNSQHKSRNS